MVNQYHPDKIFPPTLTLNEKLAEMGLSAEALAQRMEMPLEQVLAMLAGTLAIDEEMALALEQVTEISEEFWLNSQRRYEAYIDKK